MTILYLNPALLNFGPGPAVHGNALVEQLRGLGESVVTYPSLHQTLSSNGSGIPSVLRQAKRVAEGVLGPVLRVPYALQRGVRSALKAQHIGADVILARHTAYDVSPVLLARRLSRPLVLEVNAPIYLEEQLHGGSRSAFMAVMERASWRAADRIYAVSEAVRDAIVAQGIDPAKISVIPNGATPDATAPQRAHKASGEEVEIVFVGSLYRWQRLEDMIQALAQSHARGTRVRFTVIGSGDYLEPARVAVEAHGLSEITTFLGRVSHDEVRRQLGLADIAVAPYPKLNHFYFSPLKLFQYMAMGLPIIASAQGQIQTVLQDGDSGILYTPGDIDALSAAIDRLARDPDLRVRMGAAARARLQACYTWRHTAEHVRDLCADAIGAATPGRPHAELGATVR